MRRLRPRPSTRRFWQVAARAGQSLWHRVHGYVYARWPYGYIGSAIGERRDRRRQRILFAPFLAKALGKQRWADGYHGKIMPTEKATRLVRIEQEVHLTVPEQVIPFHSARDIILTQPGHIVALDCPCRLAREHPCEPLDVCLIVGEPFAGFVLEHHPDRARAITRDEAIDILHAEARQGHVHHAFFKEAMLNRFYAICNCCSCCCGAMSAHRHGSPMLISSGYVARIDEARCRACGQCAGACPFEAISIDEGVAVDVSRCMGCGVCVSRCPEQALTLQRDETKPEPLQIPGAWLAETNTT
ncbi:MAG TPA: 4Fe-4S binding protein [Chloroflexi bacterium]|jgi:ferredoxin|nr:4Fe-4S binding protein [Chloroflexota bacterium]